MMPLPQATAPARVHGPSLALALAIMVAGTVYPPLFAGADGRADHGLALWLSWAMSAGFVRGVGFVPRGAPWRWLLSAPAAFGAAAVGLAWRTLA